MKYLLDMLYVQARNPDLKEIINFLSGRHLLFNPCTKKLHPAAANVFTYIGNIAQDAGELDVMQMAREIRDEIKGLCEEEMYEREIYVEWSSL